MKINKYINLKFVFLTIGITILPINIFGIIFPIGYRNGEKNNRNFKKNDEIKRRIINKVIIEDNPIFLISYKNSLKYIDKAYEQFAKSYESINFATKVYQF